MFTMGTFYALIGAALALGLAGVGSAMGVSMAGQAAAGVVAEDQTKFGKVLLLELLPGSQGIYGLIIAFLVIMKINLFGGLFEISTEAGLALLAACLPMAIVGLLSAIYQGKVAVACIGAIAKNPDISGKALIMTAMVETYAIFALAISIIAVFMAPIAPIV